MSAGGGTMPRSSAVLGAVLALVVASCGDQPVAVPSIAGHYIWLGLDGTGFLACCSTDSGGVTSRVTSGWLDITTNTWPYPYQMTIEKVHVNANGDSVVQATLFTSGTCTFIGGVLTLSGDRLTPADSAGSGPISGRAYPMSLTIHTRGHEYLFFRPCECPP